MVLPVVAWFGAQVVAPDLVKRALDLLSQPDWRKKLVASVKRRSEPSSVVGGLPSGSPVRTSGNSW